VSVIVHIETERVQTLLVEGIRRLGSCVRVYRHRHDGGTRLAAEKIEVKEVEPRVFPGDGAPIAPARFYSFTDAEANTKEQIQKARSHPWISPEVPVRGFVYDVSTGRLSEVSPDR
jgi:carbonic anhydrase